MTTPSGTTPSGTTPSGTTPSGTDPLDVLVVPLDRPLPGTGPDPAFTADLRARLERALLRPDPLRPDPPGGTVTTLTDTTTEALTGALTPYLVVSDARAAVDFYVTAFGAVPRGEPYVQDDGRTGHAEVLVGGGLLMLADEFPELGLLGPLTRGGVSTTLHLEVPDVDAVVARAVAAGAVLEREPTDAPYGRTGVVRDPAGHRWMLQEAAPAARAPVTAPVTAPVAVPTADVAYVTLAVPSSAEARAFYGAVLGWTFSAGGVPDGWSVDATQPAVGMHGGQEPSVQLCFRVPDLARALRAVQAQGGSAQEPEDKPYGRLAECADLAGLRFQLWEPHPA